MRRRWGVLLLAALLLAAPAAADLVGEVRAALAGGGLSVAEILVAKHRAAHAETPEVLAAVSWLGRGALRAGQLDKAEAYAAETYRLAAGRLKTRALDDDSYLPVAVGAAIEVQGQVMAARGERAAALEYLRGELAKFRGTSIHGRIQKNIHQIGLEGKPAPPLEVAEWLGPKPLPLGSLRGKPVLMYFWAHWCGDCRAMAPVLARIKEEFAGAGLVLLGPTQRYGYVARGREAGPEEELRYIGEVRNTHYAELLDVPVPVSEENFKVYGASTTPTLVLLDRRGMVRLYHPGEMGYEALAEKVRAVVGDRTAAPNRRPATPARATRDTS